MIFLINLVFLKVNNINQIFTKFLKSFIIVESSTGSLVLVSFFSRLFEEKNNIQYPFISKY